MATTALTAARAQPASRALPATGAVPWTVVAVLVASTFVAAGIVWDISWHSTIGRDTFWTPAHMMEYIGGLVAGLSCGWLVLSTTFAGTSVERRRMVRFWGFRGPLGAWVAIWGTFAMLTSAPFDNWWHNAYGLDVKILSPPHTLLALGIVSIQAGALLMTVAWQNRVTAAAARAGTAAATADTALARWLYVYAAGILLLMLATMTTEYQHRVIMHSSLFYRVAALVFPFALAAAARASTLRWPATATAAVYTVTRLVGVWVLPLFPAHPKLGPIYQSVTHMVPPDFPLLVLVPAVAMDLVFQRTRSLGGWATSALAGFAFLLVFVAVQWPFATFLQDGPTRNWLFATNNYVYAMPTTAAAYRHVFVPLDRSGAAFARGMLIAALVAVLSTRVGLGAGSWMRRVWR